MSFFDCNFTKASCEPYMESNVNKTAHYKWTRVVLVDAGQLWGQSQGWVNNKLDSSEPVSDETVQEWLDAWWREEGVIERGVCHSSSLKAVVVSRLTLRLSCALSSIYVSLSALCVKYQTCLDRETHQLTAGFVFPWWDSRRDGRSLVLMNLICSVSPIIL